MSWNAYAAILREEDNPQITNEEILSQFKQAAQRVIDKAGCVDGFLETAGLNCLDCQQMLTKATGHSPYGDWTEAMVKEFNSTANWNFFYDVDSAGYFHSAKEFLDLCAKLNLAIIFT